MKTSILLILSPGAKLAFAGVLLASTSAFAVSPSQLKITVYAVAVSATATCDNPIVVAQYENGQEFDFMAATSPALVSGTMADASYPCVMLQMSDIIKFKTAAATGSCSSTTTEYTIDVCRSGGAGSFSAGTISGSTVTFAAEANCTGTAGTPANDKPWLFLSTGSVSTTGDSGSAFVVPTAAGVNGFKLNGAFTVAGDQAATFVVNFTDKIDGTGGSCDVQPPVFSFR